MTMAISTTSRTSFEPAVAPDDAAAKLRAAIDALTTTADAPR